MDATTLQSQVKSLYLALELGKSKWNLTWAVGAKGRRGVEISAGDWAAFDRELGRARHRFKVAAGTPVVSCYEAGRDGFWIHRKLASLGIRNLVVDSASIQVDRRRRRAKTDRLDGDALVQKLMQYEGGDLRAWRVVHVPQEEDEDARRLHREVERLTKERTAHRARLESLLTVKGVRARPGREFAERLAKLRGWNEQPLAPDVQGELRREHERLELVEKQLKELRRTQEARLRAAAAAAAGGQPVARRDVLVEKLRELRGVDLSAWVVVMEFFAWRAFSNEKEVGSLAGLTGTPYDSGDSTRDQGISKAGNPRVRALMVELAWSWLRYQPQSKLSRWYEERFARGGKRMRRVGIVALARKLLVAFWRYLERGELPEGAALKAA